MVVVITEGKSACTENADRRLGASVHVLDQFLVACSRKTRKGCWKNTEHVLQVHNEPIKRAETIPEVRGVPTRLRLQGCSDTRGAYWTQEGSLPTDDETLQIITNIITIQVNDTRGVYWTHEGSPPTDDETLQIINNIITFHVNDTRGMCWTHEGSPPNGR
jgi:hypothetical protein